MPGVVATVENETSAPLLGVTPTPSRPPFHGGIGCEMWSMNPPHPPGKHMILRVRKRPGMEAEDVLQADGQADDLYDAWDADLVGDVLFSSTCRVGASCGAVAAYS